MAKNSRRIPRMVSREEADFAERWLNSKLESHPFRAVSAESIKPTQLVKSKHGDHCSARPVLGSRYWCFTTELGRAAFISEFHLYGAKPLDVFPWNETKLPQPRRGDTAL